MVYTEEEYQNMVQCFVDGGYDVTEACNLYFSRYELKPSADTIRLALRSYGGTLGIPGSSSLMFRDDQVVINELNGVSPSEVFIKNEVMDSEDEILVKQENTDDAKSQIQIRLLESSPIVYTTRLDDMFIFNKDFNRLGVDEIVQNIILESKPKLTNLRNKVKNPIIHFINPFFKLVDNIRKFNELSKIESFGNFDTQPVNTNTTLSKRSQRLLEQCKQLYVLLVDFRTTLESPVVQSDCLVTEVKRDEENELNNMKPRHRMKPLKVKSTQKVKLINSESNCMVFITTATNTTEMYYINKFGVATFFCSKGHITQNKMPPNTFIMPNCCWVARETGINNIVGWPKSKSRKATCNLMRKPHRCLPGKCTCCCKIKTPFENDNNACSTDDRVSLNVPLPANETPIWLKNLTSSSFLMENNCITKALNYIRIKSRNNTIVAPKCKLPIPPDQISIKNGYTKMTEVYTVYQKEKVEKYLEVKAGEYDKLSRLLGKLFIISNEDVCCWSKLDGLLWLWRSKYSHSVLNFIRTPHNCQVNDCKCCCKSMKASTNLPVFSGSIKEIGLQKKLVHVQNYCNKSFKQRRNIKNLRKCNQTQGTIGNSVGKRFTQRSSVIPTKLPSSSPILAKEPPTLLNPPLKLAQTTIPVIPGNASQINVLPQLSLPKVAIAANPFSSIAGPIKQPLPTQSTTTKNQQNPTQTNIPHAKADAENLDPTVNSLVNSILHRFRDVRLTITPDGDVSAELNTPIQNLSTAELKILSAILTHAKEQVKALKSTPGTVINMSGFPINSGSKTDMSSAPVINAVASNVPSVNNIQGMPNTPIVNSIAKAAHVPTVNKIPSMSGTPINLGASHTPDPNKSPSLSGTPIINSVASHAPFDSNIIGMSGTPIIKSVTSLAPLKSGILNPSGTPNINSVSSNVPSNSAGTSTSILKTALSTSVKETLNAGAQDSVNKTNIRTHYSTPNNTSNVYQCYTNITALKAQQYKTSCNLFLKHKADGPIPKINSVYSLSETAVETPKPINKPKLNPNVPTEKTLDPPPIPGPSGVKRKSETGQTNSKKLKTNIQQKSGSQPNNLRRPNILKGAREKITSTTAPPMTDDIAPLPTIMPIAPVPHLQSIINTPFDPPNSIPIESGDEPALVPIIKSEEDDTPVIIPFSVENDERIESATFKSDDECILGV